MTTPRRGLGRGLAALLPPATHSNEPAEPSPVEERSVTSPANGLAERSLAFDGAKS